MPFHFLQNYYLKKQAFLCFHALAKLQHILFSFYVKKDFIKNYPEYEKILYAERLRLLNALQTLRKQITITPSLKKTVNEIEHFYEIIFSLHQLRFRVEDYSIFEMCQGEMAALEHHSVRLLNQLGKTYSSTIITPQLENFLESIHAFENVYNRIIQVIAPNPMVFLFFIQNLYAFHDEFFKLKAIA